MQNSSKRQSPLDIKPSLQAALRMIQPHAAEIRSTWRKKLFASGLLDEHVELLSPLALDKQFKELELADFESYSRHVESVAQSLQAAGIEETHAVLSLGLYLESCLPHLRKEAKTDPALALVRVTNVGQWGILRSYGEYRLVSLRRFQERERRNLARDLHDDIGHNLLVLKLYLEMMSLDLKKADPEKLAPKLEEAQALASYTVDSVRRLMLDLGPPILSQFGLLRAIRIYANQFALRTGIEVKVETTELPNELPAGQETALYRVLQGALSNVLQHSHAKHAKVTVGATRNSIVMKIEDDGAGFDVAGVLPQRAFGIMAMQERVKSLGGRFHIESRPRSVDPKRHGTRIEIDLPLEER
jgi:signal transduction histidine kinase